MFCRSCGVQNDEARPSCFACGAVLSPFPSQLGLRGQNYLIAAIVATLFCCVPFGIVGIVFASQIDSKVAAGDVVGATASAKQARMWTGIAFALGVVLLAGYGILAATGALAEMTKGAR